MSSSRPSRHRRRRSVPGDINSPEELAFVALRIAPHSQILSGAIAQYNITARTLTEAPADELAFGLTGTLDHATQEDFRRIQHTIRSTMRVRHSPHRRALSEVFPEVRNRGTEHAPALSQQQHEFEEPLQALQEQNENSAWDFSDSEADDDADFVSILSDTDAASDHSAPEVPEQEVDDHESEGNHLPGDLSDIAEDTELEDTPRGEQHEFDDGGHREHVSEGSGSSGSQTAGDWDPIDERALLIMTDPAFLGSRNAMHDRIASMSATRLTPLDGPMGVPRTPEALPFLRRVHYDAGVQTPSTTSSPRTRPAHRLRSDTATTRRRDRQVAANTSRLSIEFELHINL